MNLVRKQSWVVITQFCGNKNMHNRFGFLTVITLLSAITLPSWKFSKIKVWKLRYFVPKISYPFDICFFQKVYRTNFSITIFLVHIQSCIRTNMYWVILWSITWCVLLLFRIVARSWAVVILFVYHYHYFITVFNTTD